MTYCDVSMRIEGVPHQGSQEYRSFIKEEEGGKEEEEVEEKRGKEEEECGKRGKEWR